MRFSGVERDCLEVGCPCARVPVLFAVDMDACLYGTGGPSGT